MTSKKYPDLSIIVPVIDEQEINHLEKQNWPVSDFRNDAATTTKFVINFPAGRQFTLPSESLINTLSNVPVDVNIHRSQFVIYKDTST